MDLVVNTPDELIAAVPHVLGFEPQESLVLAPLKADLPWIRVDLPGTAQDREILWNEHIRDPLARLACPGSQMAVVCVTADRPSAELASRHVTHALESIGITSPGTLWTNGRQWVELNTGASGVITREAAGRVAAVAVYSGLAQPAESREAVAASMVGDRAPVAGVLEHEFAAAEASTPGAERGWAMDRVEEFGQDGVRLSDTEAARLLVAVQTVSTRDALWGEMSRDTAASHQALWTDVTRRAPDEVRAPAASMAAFASWLGGQGAAAWCALDQVPPDHPYTMAAIVASALETGLHPKEWESARTELQGLATELDESFTPSPTGRPERGAGPDFGMSGPARDRGSRGR